MPGVLTAAEMAELRDIHQDLGMPDSYAIKRPGAPVSDGQGGSTRPLVTVESGVCLLKTGATQPDERLVAERMGWASPYTVQLPFDSTLTPADTLDVNGRTLNVGGVLRGGYLATAVRAVCEERG